MMAPADRYTRHRFHWVEKNDREVWEWLRNGSWLRPGRTQPISEQEAAAHGWSYVAEATFPPATN